MVRFSNLSSPEYIMDLQAGQWSMLGTWRTEGKQGLPLTCAPPPPPQSQHSPQDRQATGTDILAAMLDTCYEVGHELLNGAFVLDGARNTLCDLHLIPLTAWRAKRLSQAAHGSGEPTPPLEGTSTGDTTQEPPIPQAATPWLQCKKARVRSQMAQALSHVCYLYPVPQFPELSYGE